MSVLIVRVPQDTRERLKQVARSRNVSVNKLIEEMATLTIAEHDAELRFRVRAACGAGKARRGLELLRKARRAKPLHRSR